MHKVKHKELGDMDREAIVGSYQTTTVQHYDGNKRQLFYTDIETAFPEGKKIVSVTDPDGYITHANSTFVHMSGYTRDELLGMPHYILRHPDMPKAGFQGLWDSLEKTGRWQGYVKNLRKDGGFYWVFASVFTLHRNEKIVGYTSTREAAPPEKVKAMTELYQKLLKEEQS